MSYAKSIDGLNIDVTTGKIAQSIDSLDMLLSTSEGVLQDGIVLISPANGEINVSVTPSFDWDSSTAHDAYKILIDAGENFSSPIEAYITASNYEQTEALLNATNYHWKVIGGDVTDRPAIVPVLGQKDSSQGDFEALQAFYNETQGEDIPVRANASELPNVTIAVYPYLYMINGEIHRIERDAGFNPVDWVNEGEPWLVKTGWDNMTVETMGDAVGVTVDANNRVTALDMQKITGYEKSGGYITAGNNLCGVLTEELGNLKKCKVINVKQNFLYGALPANIGNIVEIEQLSLAGTTGERRPDVYESTGAFALNHTHFVDDAPELLRTTGPFADWTDGKQMAITNVFRSELPPEWGSFTNMKFVELSYQEIQGTLPESWGNWSTSVDGFIMQMPGVDYPNKLRSTVPESWGSWVNTIAYTIGGHNTLYDTLPTGMSNWDSVNFFNIAYNEFSGAFPPLPDLANIWSFNIDRNNFGGAFPWSKIFDAPTIDMGFFKISSNEFNDIIPEYNGDLSGFVSNGSFYVNNNQFSGPVPAWFAKISPQLWNIYNNLFSGDLPQEFHNPMAPLYRNLRYIRGYNAGITGPLPKVNFRNPDRISTVVTNPSSNEITTNISLDVLYTGTVGTASTDWVRDDDIKDGIDPPWEEPWIDHEITIIVPGGGNITFISNEGTNYETGYLYARDQADLTGTEGYTYEIRVAMTGKDVMIFNESIQDVYVSSIPSLSGDTIVLADVLPTDVSGYDIWVYEPYASFAFVNFGANKFTDSIPIQWAGIKTEVSSFYLSVSNNDLSGEIKSKIEEISLLNYLDVTKNKFTPELLIRSVDVLPTKLLYDPQKTIGEPVLIQYEASGDIIIDDFQPLFEPSDNTYRWFKNGTFYQETALPRLTVPVLDTDPPTNFHLEASNVLVPDLVVETENVTLEFLEQ